MWNFACSSVRVFLPIALAAPLAIMAPHAASAGEIIKARDIYRGTNVTKENCDETRNYVWVTAYERGFCIRYYVSQDGGAGKRPVVYLSGDKSTAVLQADETSGFIRRYLYHVFGPIFDRIFGVKSEDVDTDRLMERARDISSTTGTTAIYLARMGLDGSSGYHRQRRTMLELHVMNAALDALKRKYGYEGFHLVGQSGGSTLIGAILAIRNDIQCAVPGSGLLARLSKRRTLRDEAAEWLDPSTMIPDIVRNASRVLVVTDPKDQIVERKKQDTFVELFEGAGGRIDQFYVRARDKKHHGVTDYAIFVAKGCIDGESHKRIASKLKKQVAKKIKARKKLRAKKKNEV